MVITTDSALFVWNIKPYKKGKLWVGFLGDGRFRSEIMLFDAKTNSLQPSGIYQNNQTVNAILYDTISGITWFGRDNGLTALPESPFEYIDLKQKDNILDIGFAGDSLLILTEKAVYFRYKGNLKPLLTKQQITSRIIAEWTKGYSKYGIKFKGLFDLSKGCEFASFVQGNDKIYVSTAMGAISVPDLKTYLPFGVGTFKLLKNGGAYAALNYIPLRYFNSIKKSTEFIQPKDTAGTVKDFFKILESHGTCFFASNINGLVAIKDGRLFRLNENNSAIDNILTDIENDAYGTIWCASVNGNLFQVEINEKLFIRKKIEMAKYGLIGNTIKWFKFNGRYLFIGTNKGLNVISYTTLISKQPGIEYFYNKYNGYDFVSSVSPEIGRDGKLYVHSTDKVISIDTNLICRSALTLEIYKVELNDVITDLLAIKDNALSYNTNKISIYFRTVKYPFSRNIAYRYKLNDEKWNVGNVANFTSLKPDSYTLQIEASDHETNRIYSQSINFRIVPPFWQRWWFFLFVVLAVSMIPYMIFEYRTIKIRKQQEEKNSLLRRNSQLQLQSIQVQMNPHFVFNSLNSIQNFILSSNTDEAVKYLGYLGSIIRMNLENISEEHIHLDNEVKFLEKYIEIEKMRFKDKIDFRLTNSVTDQSILIPPMLVQPIIENAIKHGIRNLNRTGIIKVNFAIENTLLKVSVEDDGVGRTLSNQFIERDHKSIGLDLIRQRLQLLNDKNKTGTYQMEIIDREKDSQPVGTRVVIVLQVLRSS